MSNTMVIEGMKISYSCQPRYVVNFSVENEGNGEGMKCINIYQLSYTNNIYVYSLYYEFLGTI